MIIKNSAQASNTTKTRLCRVKKCTTDILDVQCVWKSTFSNLLASRKSVNYKKKKKNRCCISNRNGHKAVVIN